MSFLRSFGLPNASLMTVPYSCSPIQSPRRTMWLRRQRLCCWRRGSGWECNLWEINLHAIKVVFLILTFDQSNRFEIISLDNHKTNANVFSFRLISVVPLLVRWRQWEWSRIIASGQSSPPSEPARCGWDSGWGDTEDWWRDCLHVRRGDSCQWWHWNGNKSCP